MWLIYYVLNRSRQIYANREMYIQQWREEDAMFGKPQWFRYKRVGWGLHPISWQGWAYTAAWTAVMLAPFMVLLTSRGAMEALVWLTASIALLVWDVRQIHRAKRAAEESRVEC